MRYRNMVGGCILIALASTSFEPASAMDLGPYEFSFRGDLRFVSMDAPYDSYVNDGPGLLRFDEAHDGLRVGRVMANIAGPIFETIRGDLTLSSVADDNDYLVDITEAFLEWRPYPSNRLRTRTRIGAFYAPISLEHRLVGWESPYSISGSAINTWIGEEVRTIGIEQTLSLQGASAHRNYDIAAVAGAYVGNDPMGILIFQRGWTIHDRQTGLFSSLPRPLHLAPDDETIEFFREIDGRAGYYVGAEYRYRQAHVVRALHYDNRGDPAKRSGKEPAWLSRFDSIGWRWEMDNGTTLITQGLKGDTSVGASSDGRGALISEYWSYFFLASQQWGKHRVTARYDRMYTESIRGAAFFNSEQSAIGWTIAYLFAWNASWQGAFEVLQIRGSADQRVPRGVNPHANERSVQLAIRYSL